MTSAPRSTRATTVTVLWHQPRYLRAVVALGLFSIAEHAAWVTFLVVAYERGGVGEVGAVTAALLIPAALVAPLVAKEVSGLRLRHPLAMGYLVQCIALSVTACVAATRRDEVVFYMAAVLTTVTTVFSRPAHHGAIAADDDELTMAANVATGFASGLAQLLGPLLASAVLLRFGFGEVFAIGALLLAAATVLTVGIDIGSPARDTPRRAPVWPPARPSLRDVVLHVPSQEAARSVMLLFGLLGLTTVVLGVVETLATDVGWGELGAGGAGTGALIAAAGAGLLVGASVAGVMLRRVTARGTMRWGAIVTAVALVLCAVDGGLLLGLATFCAVGTGMQMILVAGWVLLHRHVRPADTCLVFGLLESQQLVGNAVGAATAGVAIAHFGVWAVVTTSAVVLPVSMLVLTGQRVRRLVDTPADRGVRSEPVVVDRV